MAYQETKTTGYGTRVGNSLKSVLSGIEEGRQGKRIIEKIIKTI